MLSFENPGSDFPRFVGSFKVIHARAHAEGVDEFDLDFAVKALIDARQVSSSGAVGDEALLRSTRQDRSRDPLYNQLKMYSELYRMLGWLHPVRRQLTFRISVLGEYIARAPEPFDDRYKELLRELLIAITFPNPNTANIGVINARPMYRLLQITDLTGGYICRDELIVALLTLSDDLAPRAIDVAVATIFELRGDRTKLKAAVEQVATDAGVQVNTLQNYTRFPLGVLKSPVTGWADSVRLTEPYGKSMVFYKLTDFGRMYAGRVASMRDIRWQQLEAFDDENVAHFLNGCFYGMLERSGFDVGEVAELIDVSHRGCEPVLNELGLDSVASVLFSPVQEAPHAMLNLAASIEP